MIAPKLLSDQPSLRSQAGPFHETVAEAYSGLRTKARKMIEQYPGTLTLQPTAVVHEAIAKILQSTAGTGRLIGRKMIMVCISRAMHDVLVDNFRKRQSLKRGQGQRAISLQTNDAWDDSQGAVLDIKMALDQLLLTQPRQAEVIEMWSFGGFKIKEIAEALRVSISTVENDLRKARGNLLAILSDA